MSIKKSVILLICVIAVVTVFSVMQSGGDSMQVDMSDTAITLSGIGDTTMVLAYTDIQNAELVYDPDYSALMGSYQSGHFRSGFAENETWGKHHVFLTTRAGCVIILEQSDGGKTILNYNNTLSTEDIYYMLLNNMVKND